MRPGPETVAIALLVNPIKNMSIINVGLVFEKIPKSLITKSTAIMANIVLPINNLSPRHPQMKVPIKADTVLAIRQYPKK